MSASKQQGSVRKGALTGRAAEDYLAGRLGFSLETLRPFPKWFLIETVNRCNARCVMCGIDFKSKKTGTMPDALFEKIAAEIGQHAGHVEKVMLYLDGEPLMDKGLAGRIRTMKSVGVRNVNIASNASLMTAERARELIGAGLDEVYFTIDSVRKERFEAIRRGLKFETVHDNIVNFIQLRNELKPDFMIRVQMIQQDLNRGDEEEFVEYWSRRLKPGDQVAVQKAHNWASAVEVKRFGDESEVNNYPCIALWGTFVTHVDGEVGLCCMDSKDEVRLGNLNEQSITDLWTGPVMEKARQLHLGGRRHEIPICDGCTLWREDKREIKG